jgi:hypothetical protein
MVTRNDTRPASAEQRAQELGTKLPAPPQPFGTYVEAVQTDKLLILSRMLPTEGHGAKFIGRRRHSRHTALMPLSIASEGRKRKDS